MDFGISLGFFPNMTLTAKEKDAFFFFLEIVYLFIHHIV